MKTIIKLKSNNAVIFAGDGLTLDEQGATGPGWTTGVTTSDNAVLETIPGDLPVGFVGNAWAYNGAWSVLPGEQARVDALAGATLAQQRAALLLQIDTDTDALYRAVTGERGLEYARAEVEATEYKDAGYTGPVPGSVASWSEAKSKTAKWAADDILATALAWRTAQAQIRATRLGAKEAARVATDVAPVAANWAAFLSAAKAQLGVA